MPADLQIVSGLPSASRLLSDLSAFLEARGHHVHQRVATLATGLEGSPGHQAICPSAYIVLVLPILGDNDLPSEHLRTLQHWRDTQSLAGRRLFVVLKGDRHVSDEFVCPRHPIHIKLRKLFYFLRGLRILPIKLDLDTTARIASLIADELEADNAPAPCKAWDLLAQATGRPPGWDPERKRLDFDDEDNGSSLLHEISRTRLNDVFQAVRALGPCTLKLNQAQLGDSDMADLPAIPSVLAAELNSNCMSLQSASAVFPACTWLSLGANDLKVLDLTSASPGLSTLLVHKNSLEELQWPTTAGCRLKHLSVYRNRFRHFDWPAGQTDIERLNLGANPVEALPEQLAHCRHLRYLGIARTHIRHLPDWLFELPELVEVDISHIEDQLPPSQLGKLIDSGITLIKKPS
ncbi:leucine-rich repeat domain-containing protein [Pseudomonas japonica]|nr:leucine-rich repeat domain-containing protein [Pseudomonas japonica]